MYKAIIFDFFDVVHQDPFKRWLKKHGYEREGAPEEASMHLDAGRITDQEFFARLAKVSGETVEEVAEAFSDITLIDWEMVEFIKNVKTHYKTGLVSNTSVSYIEPILREHELDALFDSVTISGAIGHIKPEPEIFEHALDQLGIQANEAIFIDDNPKYAAGAAELGLETIVYTGLDKLVPELQERGIKLTD